MPVTKSRNGMHELDQTNTARFLFGEEDSSFGPDVKHYMNTTDDKFPTLVRRDEYPGLVSFTFCLY